MLPGTTEHLAQHDFADLPRDSLWVGYMTYRAEVCAFLGDVARAEARYISLNTVVTHVRNILTKTGTANRTEAAAYTLSHGCWRSRAQALALAGPG